MVQLGSSATGGPDPTRSPARQQRVESAAVMQHETAAVCACYRLFEMCYVKCVMRCPPVMGTGKKVKPEYKVQRASSAA